MADYTKFKRGSEWRKWDLHVHTPFSQLANGFGEDWDNYVKQLFQKAIANDISVIGITDYFSIEGYKKIKQDYIDKPEKLKEIFTEDEIEKISSILLLPNIEFRLNKLVGSNRINFHVLLSNEIPIADIEENFLHELDFIYEAGPQSEDEKRKLKLVNLEQLGKKLIQQHAQFKGNKELFIGMMTAVVDDVQICSLLANKKNIFEGKYLIALPSDEDLSKVSWNGQDHQARKLLIQKSDILIATNPNTIEWALGKKHSKPEEFVVEFKSLKPCIGGSDAHNFDELYTKNEDRQVWIKADLTFEGLKQITHEPEERVKIQALKPDVKNERYIISELEYIDSSNLFGNQKILLNENLNAIIGGKSSGKSLLIFSTAKSIDPEQVDKASKRLGFEGYKFDSAFDFNAVWKNGDVDLYSNSDPRSKLHKITYIPQLYINYLVEKNNKEELNILIKNILLQDSTFKLFYEETTKSISDTTSEIERLINEYFKVRKNAFDVQQKSKDTGNSENIKKSFLKIEAEILQGQKASNLSEAEFADYNKLLTEKSENDSFLRTINLKEITLGKVVTEVNNSMANLLGKTEDSQVYLKGQVDRILDELGEVPEELKAIKLKIQTDFKSLITNLGIEIKNLDLANSKIALNEKIKKNGEKLAPYLKKIAGQKELQKLATQLESEKLKYQNAIALEKQFRNLLEEYGIIRKQTATLLKKRFELYRQIEQKVNETKKDIGSDIELKCSLIYSLNNFTFYEQVNKAAISNDHYINSFYNENLINYNLIPEFYEKPLRTFEDKLFYSKEESIPLKVRTSLEDILRGLIKDSFELDYTVTYKGDNLLSMSPGKKGTVLLILFLQISSSEFPILIDQPEDNLDNRTIYDLLCKMIKERKKDRQIIIVSHNANLVVATDTENIIVANQLGQEAKSETGRYRFEYINGSLEHSFAKDESNKSILLNQGIREHVCDILEGGGEAFKQRERKYSIK